MMCAADTDDHDHEEWKQLEDNPFIDNQLLHTILQRRTTTTTTQHTERQQQHSTNTNTHRFYQHPHGNQGDPHSEEKTDEGVEVEDEEQDTNTDTDTERDRDSKITTTITITSSTTPDTSSLPLFTTGHGKAIKVSADSLEVATRWMRQQEEQQQQQQSITDCWQSSSSSSSSFSSSSLLMSAVSRSRKRSRPSMSPSPIPPSITSAAVGFTTGHGKHIHISHEAMLKARHILMGDEDEQQNDQHQPDLQMDTAVESVSSPDADPSSLLCGFTTGRGSKVVFSNASLIKAQQLLEQANTDFHNAECTANCLPADKPQNMSTRLAADIHNKENEMLHPFHSSVRLKEPDCVSPHLVAPGRQLVDSNRTMIGQSSKAFISPRATKKAPTQQAPQPQCNGQSSPIITPAALTDPVCTSTSVLRFSVCSRFDVSPSTACDPIDCSSVTSLFSSSFVFPGGLSVSSAYRDLLASGCKSDLCSLSWVTNHYRWIVWKLACTQRRFAASLPGQCLTYNQLIKQLKHRYDREQLQVKRSAIKLILEGDDTPARYMVLCIANMLGTENTANADTVCLELTDGWYSIHASVDAQLLAVKSSARLFVGLKLRVFGACLRGGNGDPCTPIENSCLPVNQQTRLHLFYNSTRRAPRSALLGFQRTQVFSVSLVSLKEGGGNPPCIYAVVSRVYPLMFMETHSDGTKSHRNQRAEDEAQYAWENNREKWAQEQQDEDTIHSHTQSTQNNGPKAATEAEAESSSHDNSSSVFPHRKVVPYVRVRLRETIPWTGLPVSSSPDGPMFSGSECLFTVWNPVESDFSALSVGTALTIFSAAVNHVFDGVLGLSANRSAPLLPTSNANHVCKEVFPLPTHFSDLPTLINGQEFDTLAKVLAESRGAVADTTSATSTSAHDAAAPTSHRYLFCISSHSCELLVIDVCESSRVRHFSASLPVGSVLVCHSLVFRGYDPHNQVYRASTSSYTQMQIHRQTGNAPPPQPNPSHYLFHFTVKVQDMLTWFNLPCCARVCTLLSAAANRLLTTGSISTAEERRALNTAMVETEREYQQARR